MEDAHTTLLKLEDTDASFFGVYDGHGGKFLYKHLCKKQTKKSCVLIIIIVHRCYHCSIHGSNLT